jgi:NAD(P)-dependent dehydrogenase (short-subunit alcohol dehydrogenase family)
MASDQSGGAVVTGAASGIGRAIAAALAKDGF